MVAEFNVPVELSDAVAMPMTYNSLVGDMGSSLSGGQKQRVLLARGLYRRPRILFLDEGTAHLDLDNEPHINESLTRLRMTRVSVAHSISAGADRVIRVEKTVQSEVCTPVGYKAITNAHPETATSEG